MLQSYVNKEAEYPLNYPQAQAIAAALRISSSENFAHKHRQGSW